MNEDSKPIMPGHFPADSPPSDGLEFSQSAESSSPFISSPQASLLAVRQELSLKQSLFETILSTDHIDVEQLEVLTAEIHSLQEEFERLTMESNLHNLLFDQEEDGNTETHNSASATTPLRTNSNDGFSKRRHSQIDDSPRDVRLTASRLRFDDTFTKAESTLPEYERVVVNGFEGFQNPFVTPAPVIPGPSNSYSGTSQYHPHAQNHHLLQIKRDEEYARSLQEADGPETIDLTGDDDDYTFWSPPPPSLQTPGQFNPASLGPFSYHPGSSSASASRVKYEPHTYGNFPGFKSEPATPLVNHHQHREVYDLTDPITNIMQGLPNVTNGEGFGSYSSQFPSNLYAGFPGHQEYLHRYPYAMGAIPPVKEDEREEVSKILENVAIHTETAPGDRIQTPKELDIKLMEHQKIGCTWLIKQEEGHNKGGILADDMGLGKTVQAITLIITRASDRPNHKTTLIVCPVSLMRQWDREIRTKVKRQYGLSTHIYHGQQPKRFKDFHELKKFDVVITSYGTLAGEYKKRKAWTENGKGRCTPTEFPFLSSESNWYRVILDESQNIKNHQTQTSQACAALIATYRLCLSGTPMQNSIDDLFGAVRFLRITRYREFKDWNRDFGRQIKLGRDYKDNAMKRLQALIRAIMLRRKKDSTIDGKPLLNLPAKHVELIHPIFDKDEKELYDAVETRVALRFNKYIEQGTVSRNYTYILVLLLRLRQVCCHPKMIKDLSMKIDAEEEDKQMRLLEQLPQDVIERLKRQDLSEECPICLEAQVSVKFTYPCGHFLCQDCLVKIVNQAEQQGIGDDGQGIACPHCRSSFQPSQVVDWNTFLKVHRPAEYAELHGQLQVIDQLLGANDPSDSEDESESESEDDSSEGDDLSGFIVNDDSDDDGLEFDDEPTQNSLDSLDSLESKEPSDDIFAMFESQKDEKPSTKRMKLEAKLDDDVFLTPGIQSQPSAREKKAKLEAESEDDMPIMRRRRRISSTKRLKKEESKDRTLFDMKYEDGLGDLLDLKDGDPTTSSKKKASKGKEKEKSTVKTSAKSKKGKEPAKKSKKKKNFRETKRKAANRGKKARQKHFQRLAKNWTGSAKINKTLEILKNIRDNDPREKTIIFSSFTSFLDLLQIPIDANPDMECERYDGSMSAKDRNDAILNFTDNPNVTVMLVSLKAGNSGLNLTAASQVIIIDPWWNPFVEEQAIDRAHRIGQQREVTVHRLIIENTVEDRILTLQDQKRDLISHAMDETAGKEVSRLNINDLVYLFTGRN